MKVEALIYSIFEVVGGAAAAGVFMVTHKAVAGFLSLLEEIQTCFSMKCINCCQVELEGKDGKEVDA